MLELMIYVPTFMKYSVSSFLSFLWRQTSKHYCKHVPRKLHLYTQQRGYLQAWTSRLSSTRLENLLHILEGDYDLRGREYFSLGFCVGSKGQLIQNVFLIFLNFPKIQRKI